MKLKVVINLFGGPGTGKSTIASGLFYHLKCQHYEVETVYEYAKELTYEQRQNVLNDDQLYVFAKQHRKLFRLKDQVDIVIMDSPLLLSCVYLNPMTSIYDPYCMRDLVLKTNKVYPNFNIYLQRKSNFDYQSYGRNQTIEEAEMVDVQIYDFLKLNNIPFKRLYPDQAMRIILEEINNMFKR